MDKRLMADLHSIGVINITSPQIAQFSYAIIEARSNPRSWLIPLTNFRVTVSGLALFQPLLFSAKLIKQAALILSLLGLSRAWVKKRISLGGHCQLARHFPSISNPMYAFFSGTEGPHRKLAVQIMDEHGQIAGFAKLSANPAVAELLRHEAAMLKATKTLQLQNANTPSLLYIGPQNGATLLVTDTLKTPFTRSVTRFTNLHKAFLLELADKTRQPPLSATQISNDFSARIAVLEHRLTEEWRNRLRRVLDELANSDNINLPCCMSHGDFTPWNTFIAQGKLYVFDWEYAEHIASQANDLIHYVLNQPNLRNQPASKQLQQLRRALQEPWINLSSRTANVAVIVYLLGQVLRQLERLSPELETFSAWDGMLQQSALLESILGNKDTVG